MTDATPGSDEAIKAGCRCPVLDNHHGAGLYALNGRPVFLMVESCKLHWRKGEAHA